MRFIHCLYLTYVCMICGTEAQFTTVTKIPSFKLTNRKTIEMNNPVGKASYCAQLGLSYSSQAFSMDTNHSTCVVNQDHSGVVVVEEHPQWELYYDVTADDHLLITSEERVYKFTESMPQTPHDMGEIQLASVIGGSVWMLYSREQFSGKRFMVKQGNWSTFYGFAGETLQSILKINDSCTNKPIGVQNPDIIPDSAMTTDNGYGGEARRARLNYADSVAAAFDSDLYQEGGFGTSGQYAWWGQAVTITIDLGALYRVYGVATQNIAWMSDGFLMATYHAGQYMLLYAATSVYGELTQYTENGEIKVFVRGSADYRVAVYQEVLEPFLARHVAVQGVEGSVYYNGIRIEYYGCEVFESPAMNGFMGDATHLTDDITGTCVTANDVTNVLRYPIPNTLHTTSQSLTLITNHESPCDVTPSVYVHINNHLKHEVGLFRACVLLETHEHSYMYQCACSYGTCEYFYVAFDYAQAHAGCANLCEITFHI